jgi:hypothetical protein
MTRLFIHQHPGGRCWMICSQDHDCEAGAHSQDIEMSNGFLINQDDRDAYQARIEWDEHQQFHDRQLDLSCRFCLDRADDVFASAQA